MIYLLLSVSCSVLIANLLKIFSSKDNTSLLYIFLGNYFVAALFSVANNSFEVRIDSIAVLILGIITGLFFIVNFLIYNFNILTNGISLSVSVMRASLVIPTFLSVFVFAEIISFINMIGIVFVLTSFLLMGNNGFNLKNIFLLLLLFLISGLSDFNLKLFESLGSGSENMFLFYIFGSAFLFNIIFISRRKLPLNRKSIFYGFLLGVPNQLSTLFFVKSLYQIPASIAYPLCAALIVVFSIFSDFIFWNSRFSLRKSVSLALILISIVFLNLR